MEDQMNYTYKSLSVPGGGFVTGFLFHPVEKDILYCRTDIGGVYRYDFKEQSWISLVDQVKDTEKWKTYPLSIALDKKHPNRLYMSVGEHEMSAIGLSEDYGESFVYMDTPKNKEGYPVEIHGNAPGRSTGERLLVDPFDSDTLYLGTMYDGLFVTYDRCKTWQSLEVGAFDEQNIAFVEVDTRAGDLDGRSKRLIVATSGQMASPDGITRGPSVYISHDGGKHFEVLEGQPEPVIGGSNDHPGFVGQRLAFDDKYMYITYSAYNIGWSNWHMYGCDTGLCYDGALFRYEFNDKGQVIEAKELTPKHPMNPSFTDDEVPRRRLGHGLSGICTDANKPGVVILTTITAKPDVFYRSVDYGQHFEPIMSGLEIGKLNFTTSYQEPRFNGNHSLIHWMSDIKINPHDSDMAVFNTGAGVFVTYNLSAHEMDEDVVFENMNTGIEETVHLNVYSPISGKYPVIDVIGDYGMFLFDDVDKIPENTVADSEGNRWITAMNADFTDTETGVMVATMRGNWTGHTKGGLIITKDGGDSFEKLPDPKPINDEIDAAVAYLKTPNVTSGWVALGADGKDLVWAIGQPLKGDLIVFSHDQGLSYGQSVFYDLDHLRICFDNKPVKIFADRSVVGRFYGFGDFDGGPVFFVSKDGGESFNQVNGPDSFPNRLLAGIDSEQDVEIRGIPFEEGEFYMAMGKDGLWKLKFNEDTFSFIGRLVSKPNDVIKRVGLGIGPSGQLDRLYTSGTIGGVYGFYRSDNGGYDWTRINDEDHQYGDIRSIDGDKHVLGRFYIATGTRGLICGQEQV